MLRACSGAIGPVLLRILVVPVCYGPSMAVGSSSCTEIWAVIEVAANGSRHVFEHRRVDAGKVTLPWIGRGRRPGDV
jgi:hypothetical protein